MNESRENPNLAILPLLEPFLKNRKILLGISGSIAAFRSCELVRLFRKCGATIRVCPSKSARDFVSELSLEVLSENKLANDLREHIHLARWADLMILAPATAHSIAKLACGLADELFFMESLVFRGPFIVAPAMNPSMYSHPAVQENIQKLKDRGILLAGPAQGTTACGETGEGRMSEPLEILEKAAQVFYPSSPLENPSNKILISLGPTRTSLDPVRYLSNRSSGKMGAALCWAAVQKGFQVTVVSGPCSVSLPSSVNRIEVNTSSEMAEAILSQWPEHAVYIGAAAVLDWEVDGYSSQKIKKESGIPSFELKPSPDILKTVSARKRPDQLVLGFAAETENPLQNGLAKLRQKNCDAIFINDVSRADQGLDSDRNSGWWITQKNPNPVSFSSTTKIEIARQIIELTSCLYFSQSKKLPPDPQA